MTDKLETIPSEQLELARRRLCAEVASTIIRSMAESNTTFEQADSRLGRAPGFTKGYIVNLITFEHGMMKEIAYVAEAMNVRVEIGMERIVPERPLVNRHIPISDIEEYNWLFQTKEEWDALDPYTLIEVMDATTTFHIGPKLSFNEEYVLRWKLFKPFKEGVD